MNKTTFKADTDKSGFIRTTVAPVNEKKEPRFTPWDTFELVTAVLGIILVMRYLLR